MMAGPLYPDCDAFHRTSVISRACSSWLTPAVCGALVGAPISVIQIFLAPSWMSITIWRTSSTSDQPLWTSTAKPWGKTYGCIAIASKYPFAPDAYMLLTNVGGDQSGSSAGL